MYGGEHTGRLSVDSMAVAMADIGKFLFRDGKDAPW